MPEPFYVLLHFAVSFFGMIELATFARMIFTWFFEPEGKLYRFLYVISEPMVLPFRKLFKKDEEQQTSPMDTALFCALGVLFLIQMLLQEILYL